MNLMNKNNQRGSLKWIIIIIIGLVLASYFFDFSVQETVEDEQTQSNFNYITTNVVSFWNEHLSTTAHYLWDDVFLDIIWSAFTENLESLREGENTVFEEFAPGVDLENTTAGVVNPPITAGFVDSE